MKKSEAIEIIFKELTDESYSNSCSTTAHNILYKLLEAGMLPPDDSIYCHDCGRPDHEWEQEDKIYPCNVCGIYVLNNIICTKCYEEH